MSDNRNKGSNAGLFGAGLVAGGALVGAAAVTLYEWFTSTPTIASEQSNSASPRERSSRTCTLCATDTTASLTISLPCSHFFHARCLKANYILHMNEQTYKCPACGTLVPQSVTNEFYDHP